MKKKQGTPQETTCINGPLSVGDAVLSSPDSDYSLLYGFVTDIQPIGNTSNKTDDIYVDFSSSVDNFTDERAAALCGGEYEPGFDSVIMSPSELKRVALSVEEFDEMCESVENARALFNAAN